MSNPLRIADRVNLLRPTAVNAVLDEVRGLQAQGRTLVSLMRGQPDSPTPQPIVAEAQRALAAGRTGYPDNLGEPALRQAVARRLEKDHGLKYDPATELLITDGATGGLCTALGALVQPGDDVLLPDPIYDAYTSPIRLWGGRAVVVPAAIRDGRFTLDVNALEGADTPQSKVLILNSPWNPVGTVFHRDELAAIAEFARKHDLILLSDEIYESLVYDGLQHVSVAALAPERTVLINSLSKTYAMTGWRIGYCAGPAALIEAMRLVWPQWSRGPATFVQDAAIAALGLETQVIRAMAREYEGRRDRVLDGLRGIPKVHPLKPAGGLFVMVDIRELGISSDAVRRSLLHEEGVVVIHGAAYGTSGEGTLRVSFAAGGAVLERGLERLRAGLLRLAKAGKE